MTATPARGELDIPVTNRITMELDEYPSPAFMKRARLSYGALFEDPEDKMEEDGGVRGNGRKRTRFGRDSSSWRYASQSPSPSPEVEPKTPPQTAEAAVEVDMEKPSPPKPQVADEGCQTMDFEAANGQAKQLGTEGGFDDELRRNDRPTLPTKDQPSQPSGSPKTQLPVGHREDQSARKPFVQKPAESDKPAAVPKAPAESSRFGSNTLFGNFASSHSGYDKPRFGITARGETGGGLGIANQVRFGFSHTPQTDFPSHRGLPPQRVGEDCPEPQLEPSDPSKYADMETYVDPAEQDMEAEPQYAYDGDDLNPPVSESFAGGQFDVATQAPGYNPVEGGHFGADALDEGTRITTDGYPILNDQIDVDKVPQGFASFGGGLENQIEDDEMEEDEEQPHIPGEDFVENDELEDDLDDEVAVEDRDSTEYGPEGEVIEQGDYDQRQYNTPEEDHDDVSEEEQQQKELQAIAQNSDPDVVDEDELYDDRMDDDQDEEDQEGSDEVDDDQGSYDEEEEEGFDEDDDDQGSSDDNEGSSEGSYSHGPDAFYDNTSQTWVPRGARPMQPAAPPAAKIPVVIDLLSDSEDDEPPSKPVKQHAPEPSKPTEPPAPEPPRLVEQYASAPFPSVPSEPVNQDQSPTRQNLNAGDQHDAVLEPSPGPEQRQVPRERRKSSGSHLYGENIEEPMDDSKMDLHLPSTPPPDKQDGDVSHAGAINDVANAANDDDDTARSIPGFNGAAESKVDRGTEHAEVVSGGEGGERGEDGPSETASSVLHSAPNQQENKGAELPEPNEDGGTLPAQEAHDSENQEMADAVTQRFSNPPRSVGDADKTEAGPESVDISKRDVAEVERLFEEVEVPDQDIAMADGNEVNEEDAPPRDEGAKQNHPQAEQAVESHDQHATAGSQEPDRQVDNNGQEQAELPHMAPSSPPPSQSFASQVFTSSPPSKDEGLAHLPTPMETQPSQTSFQTFIPRQTFMPESPASDAPAPQQELGETPVATTVTTVEAAHIHVEQQAATGTDEEDCDVSKSDIQMTDAPADDADAASEMAEHPLATTNGRDVEEEIDIEEQIQAQLQFEIVRTTVQQGADQVTVVQETSRVSVPHVSGENISRPEASPAPAQETRPAEEDVPVEPASLEQAIQEELMLQDMVDKEIASELGDQDDTAEVAESKDMGNDDDVDVDEDMEVDDEEVEEEEPTMEEEAAEVEEEEPTMEEDAAEIEDDNGAGDAGELADVAAPDSMVEETAEEEPEAEVGARDTTAEEGEAQPDATPPLRTETIDVVPGEEHQEPAVEEDDYQQEPTIAVVPDADQEEVILIGQEDAPEQQPEAEDTQETPVNATPPKPKQDLEVLIRPRTRSRRAKDQQSQIEEATPHEDTSTRETTKEASPDVSTAPKRATGGPKRSARAKGSRDPSIELAKASIQKRGAGRRRVQEVAPEPRRTRQRSASTQTSPPSETEEEEEDSSVALAKAALQSPSRKRAGSASTTGATSQADLVRRLRISLREFTRLKSLRHHKRGHPHVLAVVACDPPEPQRTKHRDFHTTVTVTDASVAPDQVVEVQFMHTHRVYLPAVKQGDTIVLRNFEVVSLADKQFALKQRTGESSWAVYDADYEVPGTRGGPDFEIQEAVRDYLHDLRVWYHDLDVLDREKLVTAMKRLAETGHPEDATS
jgi:hypothetical protein